MAQPVDWLAPFIEKEINSAIAWKKNVKKASRVKHDPDARFTDDGSNLRSIATANLLPADSKLQISKILSVKDPVTVSVTDGFTCVKAILSRAVKNSLEAEIGDELDLDMQNDVIIKTSFRFRNENEKWTEHT